MSYAYIEGQEAAALDFFEKRLQQAIDPEERRELSALVEKLRRKLQDKNELAKVSRALLRMGSRMRPEVQPVL